MIHWLLAVVWPEALHAAIYTATSAVTAILIVAPLRGALKRLRSRMASVLDSLDPDVPIGLTRQLDEMKGELVQIHSHLAHAEPVQVRSRPGRGAA